MIQNHRSVSRRDFAKLTALTTTGILLRGSLGAAEANVNSSSDKILGGKKFLIGHRGACAYAPENTLPSYQLAIKQGVDFVEQDLQVTKDNVLLCSHDETLERVSNVMDVFPERFTEVAVKGKKVRRWFIRNFTLKEIKQLDAGEKFDAKFKGTTFPTWEEAIEAIRGNAGLCPETKDPEGYSKLGFNMEQLVMQTLKKTGLDKPDASTPLLMQSFSHASLKRLVQYGIKYPLLQLASAGMKWTPAKMDEAKELAGAIGLAKNDVTEELVREAHGKGLQVVAYTYNAKGLLPAYPRIRAEIEHAVYDVGIDGVFTDNPDEFPRRKG